MLAKARGLKVISRCGIGLDSVDLIAAKEFGIKVCNTPGSAGNRGRGIDGGANT